MAVFNNGSITASVTPPQGFTGTYQYSLFKYNSSNGTWELVNGATEGFTGTFINPTSTVSTTHVFGNPGGYDENKQGDQNSWVGLTPGNYRVEVEALNSNCPAIITDVTVGTQDPADPEFTCSDTTITIPDGTIGDTVTATATNGVVGTITPSEYQNGTQSYNVEITVPAGYSNIGSTVTCTASAEGTPVLAPFICSATSITIADGTTGDTIPTSAVTATGVSNIIAVYNIGTTTPATYIDGTQEVHVVFEVPAGYSNTGDSFTCFVDATGTPALTAFTCTDANFQVADGTTGQDVTATVTAGTLNSVSPAQYTEGSATYTANITVPAGYSNSGETLTTCTDTAVGTTILPTFTCTDANFQVADGTTGQDVTATVAAGTLNSVSPAQYTEGSATYTANITVPAGYSNSGETLTTCTDTAIGTTVIPNNITWYWFHGLDTNWLSAGSSYYLTDAPQFGMFTNGANVVVTQDLSEAMQHYFDNQASITGGKDILTTEFAGPITGTSQEFVFNALSSGTGDYYLMVPATADFPEDLTTAGICEFPAPGTPQNVPQKASVTVNGEDYVLYLMPGSADGGSRTLAFA